MDMRRASTTRRMINVLGDVYQEILLLEGLQKLLDTTNP